MKTLLLDINSVLNEAGDTVDEITAYYKDKFGVKIVLIDTSKQNLRSTGNFNTALGDKFLKC